jgi:hypothetical protein
VEFLKAQGRLIYDPPRTDLKKVHKSRTLVIELPWDDLDLYYQWHLRKRYGSWFDHELRKQRVYNETQTALREIDENIPCVTRPMWGKHVTVVRGDEPGWKSQNWGKHAGEKIDVFYTPHLQRTWKFWSLPVKDDNLFELRRELGLKAFHDFHITVAREMTNESSNQRSKR